MLVIQLGLGHSYECMVIAWETALSVEAGIIMIK